MKDYYRPNFLARLGKALCEGTRPASVLALIMACGLSSCASSRPANEIRVSVADQKIALIADGKPVKVYKCSTSKFGVGDRNGSYATPVGKLRVVQKIGSGQPIGRVFHGRQPSREIVQPNSPGRDPIVTRILWLAGTESSNAQAYRRCIYIHGTPEERTIGQPASYGCVRMKSRDVVDLFNQVPLGIPVNIVRGRLNNQEHQVAAVQERAQQIQPPAPILPPMDPAIRPQAPASAASMVARNGKPRLGPEVPTKARTKRVAKN